MGLRLFLRVLDVLGGGSLILNIESLDFPRWLVNLILLEILKEPKDRLPQKLFCLKKALMGAQMGPILSARHQNIFILY